jgi:hypothetical protein
MLSIPRFSLFAIIIGVASCESNFQKPSFCRRSFDPLKISNGEAKHLSLSSDKSVASAHILSQTLDIPRGGSWFPAGYHPYGYGLTELGLEFLKFEGSLDSDIGRFLASLKSGRKKQKILKEQWVEVVRVSKAGQSMRILRTLDDLIEFCIKVGFID